MDDSGLADGNTNEGPALLLPPPDPPPPPPGPPLNSFVLKSALMLDDPCAPRTLTFFQGLNTNYIDFQLDLRAHFR